jgi:hypothetical protein
MASRSEIQAMLAHARGNLFSADLTLQTHHGSAAGCISGDLSAVVDGADPNRICLKYELPTLLKNPEANAIFQRESVRHEVSQTREW